MGRSGDGFQSFYTVRLLYAIIVLQDFLSQWNYFFPLLDDFLRCGLALSIEYSDAHSFTVYKMGLMTPLVFFNILVLCQIKHFVHYEPFTSTWVLNVSFESILTPNSCVHTLFTISSFSTSFFIRATNKMAFISIN